MIKLAAPPLMLLLLAVGAAAQESSPVRCVITLYSLREENGELLKSLEFVPRMGEEELTNKNVRLPGRNLFVVASVFPTDESMHSATGADSLKLGLALARKPRANAFDSSSNAVAEVTLRAFDTVRVEQRLRAGQKEMVARLECWDPSREEK